MGFDFPRIFARLRTWEETAPTGATRLAMQARRAIVHLLLALFLLLSQQAAFSHAASHLGSPVSQDKQLPHSKVCDQCVQGAQLGTALLDSGLKCAWVANSGAHPAAALATAYFPRFVFCFSPRAPPASA